MSPPLEIKDLVKDYGPLRAVDHVSFSIEQGEIFGLLGPNGAGKTSIISILNTLEHATSGQALIFGKEASEGHAYTQSLIGCVPQEIVSHGFFTVEEVLNFHSGYYGISNNKEHIRFLLDRLGLKEHAEKRVRQLSGGMKRRLLIAKALVHKPRLLLLDEPTAGVDVELRNSLWTFVRELNTQGVSILLTTHYLEEAETLCGRVGIIHKGKILQVGNTKELVKKLTMREITFTFREPVNGSKTMHFRVSNDVVLGKLMQDSKIPIPLLDDVRIREGKLEDAFLNLVEK